MQLKRRPTLYALEGYEEQITPSTINLYRDRGTSQLVASLPATDPRAPSRRDTTVTVHGQLYTLVWLD